MRELNSLYSKVLHFGLLFVREAIRLKDYEWAEAEVEFLHNIPSLLDEPTVERHRYFWLTERDSYIQWVNASGREKTQSRMRTYYEPLWLEMEPIMTSILSG